ncbi:hypothetical protein [uncultured Gilliamella sp.]|jgi:hypothetical protein|uniref:hypothetical protein n=1 Tax=uncultured Gilliamella sp. TaxID=1193505 RepID=UPI0025CC935A|nr:hypothetical protein [uncultured Gilliamella sp.]
MSNDICGYIEPILTEDKIIKLSEFIEHSQLGITKIAINELYNYPTNLIPNDNVFAFLIGDVPGYPNATYLIDYSEYAPDTDIGFPADPKQRLDILVNTLIDMIKITNASKMVVSMTECNQIETIKRINFSQMREIIHADFEAYQAPPDTLYEIIC